LLLNHGYVSRNEVIQARLKELKIGFFFVVGLEIHKSISSPFRLEKSQF